jgi:hypothetical protein
MSSGDEEKQDASWKLRELISEFEAEHGPTVALATLGLAAVKIVRSNNLKEVNMDLGDTGGSMAVSGFGSIGKNNEASSEQSGPEQETAIPQDRTLH